MTDSFLPKTHFTEHRKEYTEADVRLIIEAHEAELRRQHEVIQTLLEALREAEFELDNNPMAYQEKDNAIHKARAALNKAKEQS